MSSFVDDLDVEVVSDRIILTESSYEKANGHVVSLGRNLLTIKINMRGCVEMVVGGGTFMACMTCRTFMTCMSCINYRICMACMT